ncbi:MAG: hypothetical protein ACI9H6_000861 [Patiriisocius sp.]|jgi:hypothetical protein
MYMHKTHLIIAIWITIVLIVFSGAFAVYMVLTRGDADTTPDDDAMINADEADLSGPQAPVETPNEDITEAQKNAIMAELESSNQQVVVPEDGEELPPAVEVEIDAIMAELEAGSQQEVVLDPELDAPASSDGITLEPSTQTVEGETVEVAGELSREEIDAIMADLESSANQEVEPEL